jgi:hypothetical protein
MSKFVLVPFKEFERFKQLDQELVRQEMDQDVGQVIQRGGGGGGKSNPEIEGEEKKNKLQTSDLTPEQVNDDIESGISGERLPKESSNELTNQNSLDNVANSSPLPPPGLPAKKRRKVDKERRKTRKSLEKSESC